MKQIKKYILYIGIFFILGSLTVSCSSSEATTGLTWVIGIFSTVMGACVTAVLGFQIYNSLTLDKRIEKASQKIIQKNTEELKKSEIKTHIACFYRVEGIAFKLNIWKNDFTSAMESLNLMVDYAITLQDPPTLDDAARMVINSYTIIEKYNKEFAHNHIKLYLDLAKKVSHHLERGSTYEADLDNFIYQLTKLLRQFEDLEDPPVQSSNSKTTVNQSSK